MENNKRNQFGTPTSFLPTKTEILEKPPDTISVAVPIQAVGSARQQILIFLSEQTQPVKPFVIADETGLNRNSVRREMHTLFKSGLVQRNEKHAYSLASK